MSSSSTPRRPRPPRLPRMEDGWLVCEASLLLPPPADDDLPGAPGTPDPTDSGFSEPDGPQGEDGDDGGAAVRIEVQRAQGGRRVAFRVEVGRGGSLDELRRALYARFPVFAPRPDEQTEFLFAGRPMRDLADAEDGCVVHWVGGDQVAAPRAGRGGCASPAEAAERLAGLGFGC